MRLIYVPASHPLQEQVVDIFVPNNAQLVAGVGFGASAERQTDMDHTSTWSSIVLCTGANACGKVSSKRVTIRSCCIPALAECLLKTGEVLTSHYVKFIERSAGCSHPIYGSGL